MLMQSMSPVAAMLASLSGVALLGALGKVPRARDLIALAVAAAQLLCVLTMLPDVLAGHEISVTLLTFVPSVAIAFHVDALGLVFAITASALWLVTTVYAIGYLDATQSPARRRFHACFALTMTATMGVAFASNLLTMYLFYEAMTLATYYLVTHEGTDEAYAGGRKYVSYHLGTSIAFLLPAIMLTFHAAGTFDFTPGGVFSAETVEAHRGLLVVIYVLFLAGSAKVAMMPMHGWLPAAMVAPVPVSALLHAVAVVNAGAFGLLRVMFDVFGPEAMQSLGLSTLTVYVSSFTILAASFYALRLDSLKALLAYSTIGQLAYIILGGALMNPNGMTGGVAHIINHGVSKITLFLCAGAIYVAAHRKYLSEMGGIGRRMPWTMAAFVIGACSMIGFPATAGFISKWFLLVGAFEAHHVVAMVVLIVSSLLSAGYYLRAIGVLGGTRQPSRPQGSLPQGHANPHATPLSAVREPSRWMLWPLLFTAGLTVLLGVLPEATVLSLIRAVPGIGSPFP